MRLSRSRQPDKNPSLSIMLEAADAPGRPLEPAIRGEMESRFGHDFSSVRIHDDSTAALAAKVAGASAFTRGHDIIFDAKRYAPETPTGKQLLGHELAHVIQQRGESSAYAIGPSESSAEREARSASLAVANDVPVPGVTARTSGIVQRSVAGDVGGALIGAAGGAVLGALVGGPVGALVGGLLGGLVGLIAGDALSADKRPLTSQEQTEAELVFGKSLNYGAVKIAEAPIMGIGDNARTPFDTIYFPPGTLKMAFTDFMPWLIHELTHAWQYQHGVSVATKLFWALHGAKAYDYGGEAGLRQAVRNGKHFSDFQTEQQGDILRDYYVRLKAGRDTSAYDPFVAEVKSGGKKGPDKK